MKNSQSITLKPHKIAFFLPSLLVISLIMLTLFITAYFGVKEAEGDIGVFKSVFSVMFFVVFGITYWLVSIKYRKTSYILDRDRIIYKTGTIFSDKELELPIRNITHLKLELPYILYLLFKIGNVYIESAGSDATEGKFFAVSNPREIYKKIQEMMKNNGFSMEKKELKEELRPHPLAVVMETLKFIGTAVFVIFYIGGNILVGDESSEMEINENFIEIATIIGFVVLGIILVSAIFRYLDLRKRVYKVYNDTVEYEEGFLTKNYSLIPFENLTDSLSTQTFVDRIFGLHDVELSCQGAKREIKFKNIVNGEELAKSVGDLIRKFKKTNKKTINPAKKSKNLRAESFLDFDKSYTAEFRMNKLRAFAFPLMLLIFVGIGAIFSADLIGIATIAVFSAISIFIKVVSTKYIIDKESISYHYKFLSAKNISFINEKVTSVILRESWIDKIFGTCQIHFGSIGSATKIKFMHLKKTENLYANILSKFGFVAEKVEYELTPNFTFLNWMKSAIILPVLLIIFVWSLVLGAKIAGGTALFIILGGIIALFLVIFGYMKLYYKNSRIFLHKNYLSVKKGLLVQLQVYSSYANIKNITTVKYPLTTVGMVKFDVAGENAANINQSQEEQVVKGLVVGQRTGSVARTSHTLSLNYITDIPLLNDLLDKILEKPMTSNEIKKLAENLAKNPIKDKMTASPSLKNYLVLPTFILLIFSIPFVLAAMTGGIDGGFGGTLAIGIFLFMGMVFALIVWNVKNISFGIQDFRVLRRSGIFYRKQISILYSKIDFINKSEGFWNKVFKNGNIGIQTIGSSKTEMMMNNLNEFQEFYKEIKESL